MFTGIGALCWLPSIGRWADVVARLLRPGGELFIREGHPVIWAMDDPRPDRLVAFEYPYFETEGIPFAEDTTYVDHDGTRSSRHRELQPRTRGDLQRLSVARVRDHRVEEHDSVPWPALGDQMADIGGESSA
ncbi:MAG: hypothetical protein R2697_14260 [Ilumatobacteraceae bacterium]